MTYTGNREALHIFGKLHLRRTDTRYTAKQEGMPTLLECGVVMLDAAANVGVSVAIQF